MRIPLLLLLAVPLPGCEAVVPLAAANGVSLMLTGRAVPDLVVSGLSGRDCSIAYLDAGARYCRPDPLPVAQPYCTRSRGAVDCWTGPVPGDPPPASVAQARPDHAPEAWPERRL